MLYEIRTKMFEPAEEKFFIDLSVPEIEKIKEEYAHSHESDYKVKIGEKEIAVSDIDSFSKCEFQPFSKDDIIALGKPYKADIEVEQFVDDTHLAHFWYGGDAVNIHYNGYTFHISAIGDVRATLLSDKNEEIAEVKDKNNAGVFYDEMKHHLKNDQDLFTQIEKGKLIFENNNWWEISCTDAEGFWHDLFWCADGYLIQEAVGEALENMDKYIEGVIL